jgi:hypothetical protein
VLLSKRLATRYPVLGARRPGTLAHAGVPFILVRLNSEHSLEPRIELPRAEYREPGAGSYIDIKSNCS